MQAVVDKAQKTRDAASKKFPDLVEYKTFDGKWAPGMALDALVDKIPGLTSQMGDAERAFDDADAKLQMAQSDLSELNAKIAEQEKILGDYGEIVNGTSDTIISMSDASQIAFDGVTEKAEALMDAYNNAYKAAYDSVSGQYQLWDQVADAAKRDAAKMDVADINDALSSQADYWNAYGDNIDKVLKKADEISGLRDAVASSADGSQDAVNLFAGLADASDETIKTFVENSKKPKKQNSRYLMV